MQGEEADNRVYDVMMNDTQCSGGIIMGRWNTVARRWWMVVVAVLLTGALADPARQLAFAQNPAKSDAWYAVVDTDRLNIHSGRAEQFEKIGTLNKGDIVLVKSVNTFGWAAIAPPAGLHGFVARQDVADGASAGTVRAIGRVPVLYPISEDPAQCFRKSRVDPDTVLKVLGEVPTADNTMYLKVAMPEQVDVYVLAQFLRKATNEEVAAWKKRLKEEAEKSVQEAPAVTPLPEPKPQPETRPEPKVEPEVQPKAEPAVEQTPAVTGLEPKPAPKVEPDTTPPVVTQPKPEPTLPPTRDPEVEQTPALGDALPEATAPTAEEPSAPVEEAEKPIVATLPNLEQLYTELVKVPILEAEVEPLLKAYEGFAAKTEKEGERRVAEIRISLLKIRLDQQNAMRKLKTAAEAANQPVAAPKVEIWKDANDRPVYTAQGRLASSNVFDGRRLPLLYRIQDEITGRTVAYLRVDLKERLDIESRLNLKVGVVGETVRDAGLRIEVVNVKRIVNLEDDQ